MNELIPGFFFPPTLLLQLVKIIIVELNVCGRPMNCKTKMPDDELTGILKSPLLCYQLLIQFYYLLTRLEADKTFEVTCQADWNISLKTKYENSQMSL